MWSDLNSNGVFTCRLLHFGHVSLALIEFYIPWKRKGDGSFISSVIVTTNIDFLVNMNKDKYNQLLRWKEECCRTRVIGCEKNKFVLLIMERGEDRSSYRPFLEDSWISSSRTCLKWLWNTCFRNYFINTSTIQAAALRIMCSQNKTTKKKKSNLIRRWYLVE